MGTDVAVGVGIAVGKEVGPEVPASLGVELGVDLGVPSAPQAASTIPTKASETTRAMSGKACNLRRAHREEPLSEFPLGVPNSPISAHDLSTVLYSLQRPDSTVHQPSREKTPEMIRFPE